MEELDLRFQTLHALIIAEGASDLLSLVFYIKETATFLRKGPVPKGCFPLYVMLCSLLDFGKREANRRKRQNDVDEMIIQYFT